MTLHRFLVLLFSIILISCFEENEENIQIPEEVGIQDIDICHFDKVWDPASVRNNLEGEWDLKYQSCQEHLENVNSDISIKFKGVDKLTIRKEGKIVQTLKWNLKSTAGSFRIITNEPVPYLDGYLLFCHNQMAIIGLDPNPCKQMFFRKIE